MYALRYAAWSSCARMLTNPIEWCSWMLRKRFWLAAEPPRSMVRATEAWSLSVCNGVEIIAGKEE